MTTQSYRDCVLEEAAQLVEQMQETISVTRNGSEHHLTPRKNGNLMGLAFAAGIRALKTPTQKFMPCGCHDCLVKRDKEQAAEIVRLRRIEAAARNLMDNSPVGDDDKPYCSDVAQSEFKALYLSLQPQN